MIALSKNSVFTLQQRYLRKDTNGNIIETPAKLFKRVAKAIAAAELFWGTKKEAALWEKIFYEMMSNMLFLPNSPTLMNAGTATGQLSACFVLPVEDNMKSIFTTLKNAALIQQQGGGTGFNFSALRPKDDLVFETGGTASGPVSFMQIFDAATEHIKQGGKRRGANMGILNIDHPDIEPFINIKKEKGELNNFNISVAISDAFMNAVAKNQYWNLIHPNSKKIIKKVAARKIWNSIIESAWQTGDPGLIFIDTINTANPTPQAGKINATNPCGEVPLLPYEACNLGSVNLTKFVKHKKGIAYIDWQHLGSVVKNAIRFLDDVIEVNNYIIPEIKLTTLANRKVGLGVMGWADFLILLEIPYASDKAIHLADQLMQFIQEQSKIASTELAKKRGAFPNWKRSSNNNNLLVRNATLTSIAPTGTISIIADTSPSIEPLFAIAFQRKNVLNGATLNSINSHFIHYLKKEHLYSDSIIKAVIKSGTLENITSLSAKVKNIFKTATEISPMWHLKHQLAFQRHTDNAVSKTINLSERSTLKAVNNIYRTAWQQKAKGITIYRANTKEKQVIQPGISYRTKSCTICSDEIL